MIDKIVRYFLLFIVGLVGSGHSAHGQTSPSGDNALQQLGKAQQQHYNDVKRLGPNPTKAQLKEAELKAFSSAKKAWKDESEQLFQKYEKEGSKMLFKMVTEGAIPSLTPSNTSEKDDGSPDPVVSDKPALAGEAPSADKAAAKPAGDGANRRVGSLGESQGAEGAKYVDFGIQPTAPAQESKPGVVDGIIQNK